MQMNNKTIIEFGSRQIYEINVIYYIKYSALQGFQALVKLIISHVRLFMIISHVKIIAFQTITYHSFYRHFILVENL